MLGNLRRQPAAVISVLALFFAMSGGALAGGVLIGSAQIRDHSIQLADLSPSAVAALRGHRGAAGADGTFDPAKITSAISVPPVTVQPNTVGSASATCPAGAVAISGGGSASIAGITASGPVMQQGTGYPVGWYVLVANQSPIPVDIHADVVCATP